MNSFDKMVDYVAASTVKINKKESKFISNWLAISHYLVFVAVCTVIIKIIKKQFSQKNVDL